jgi:hypothetical protein
VKDRDCVALDQSRSGFLVAALLTDRNNDTVTDATASPAKLPLAAASLVDLTRSRSYVGK